MLEESDILEFDSVSHGLRVFSASIDFISTGLDAIITAAENDKEDYITQSGHESLAFYLGSITRLSEQIYRQFALEYKTQEPIPMVCDMQQGDLAAVQKFNPIIQDTVRATLDEVCCSAQFVFSSLENATKDEHYDRPIMTEFSGLRNMLYCIKAATQMCHDSLIVVENAEQSEAEEEA